MKPTFKIFVETIHGPAIITSFEEFNDLGPYKVEGPGAEIAREWIEGAHGAFGHTCGTYAAPCDLHAAAMDLQQDPPSELRFVGIWGEVKEYNSGIPEGSVS